MMILDPAGFRWLSEGQLKIDRGVAFYNTASIRSPTTFIANRLLFLGLGLGAVVFSQRHFRATLRGESRQASRAWQLYGKKLGLLDTHRGHRIGHPKPLGTLGDDREFARLLLGCLDRGAAPRSSSFFRVPGFISSYRC